MGPSAVTAFVVRLSAVFGKVIPTLALEASGWFALGLFYKTSPVADGQSVSDSSIGRVGAVEG